MIWYIVYDDGTYYPHDINNYCSLKSTVYHLRDELTYRYSRNLFDKIKYFLHDYYISTWYFIGENSPTIIVIKSRLDYPITRHQFISFSRIRNNHKLLDGHELGYFGDFKSYFYLGYDKIYFVND